MASHALFAKLVQEAERTRLIHSLQLWISDLWSAVFELWTGFWSIFPAEIDPGYAAIFGSVVSGCVAVIAAYIAFTNISRQARLGFRSLIRSQANQAKLDRDARVEQSVLDRVAREHQADLSRISEANRKTEERKTLANSLVGEISAITQQVKDRQLIARLYIEWMNTGVEIPGLDLSKLLMSYKAPVFDANIHKIGDLGASMASDIVLVWALPQSVYTGATPINSNREMAILFLQGLNDAHEQWTFDAYHVQERLLAMLSGSADPGPVFFARKKRKEAAVSASKGGKAQVQPT
ncbi:hypothetical protein [Aureimonas sp. Leaf454]|uniref:hypothetical protein n=1 Tax=Aureimonas sp. Leaf454 TaxID=1736381 RepID=UPI00138F4B0B|nr:hypothetical protein [Aureimonas sp. Leaf454]